MQPIFETSRLLLREMSLRDLDFVATQLADPDVMRFYPKRYSREESEQWVRRQMARYKRDGHGLWLVTDKDSGRPLGQVGLMMQTVDGVKEAEVGYLIHAPYWRNGFATEAATATRDYAFETLHKPRVISLIRPVNVPSQGVARKMRMMPEKHTMHANLEHIVFSVTPEDLRDD